MSIVSWHLDENEQVDEDEDVVLVKENQGECILGISGCCGGNIRRIWCWISSDGWYVGYRVTDDSHYLSKGMEPLSPSISWASERHFPLCKGEWFKIVFFSSGDSAQKCRSQVKCGCVRRLKLGFPKFARKINQDLPLTPHILASHCSTIQDIRNWSKVPSLL